MGLSVVSLSWKLTLPDRIRTKRFQEPGFNSTHSSLSPTMFFSTAIQRAGLFMGLITQDLDSNPTFTDNRLYTMLCINVSDTLYHATVITDNPINIPILIKVIQM